jgi:translation initiation factor 2 beta subunit (eIF-2beta)/eIF-5
MSKTINIDKNIVKNILSKKLGQSEIEFNIDDHQIKFVKV